MRKTKTDRVVMDNGHRFQAGNPGGQLQLASKAAALLLPAAFATPRDVAMRARRYTNKCLRTLANILQDGNEKGANRIRAAEILLARGWGTPDKGVDPLAGLSEEELQEAARQILKGRIAGAALPATVISDKTIVTGGTVITAPGDEEPAK